MKNIAIFPFTLIASFAALVGLGAHAQPLRGDCSAVFTGQEVDRTIINERTEHPVQVLITALQAENRMVDGRPVPIIVELCNVELDLNEHLHLTRQPLIIKSDRALIASASPGCARGPRNEGPRIYVRGVSGIRASGHLFEIRGDNVVISGFRLEGPHPEPIVKGDDNTERGITISPGISPDLARQPIRHIEICNMDMYHWSGAAIEVLDNVALDAERGRLLNTNEGAVHISNNFLHHNRHGEGWGYGVVVSKGAYALIERNVFDENRHAIAGDSVNKANNKDFSGYTARANLILPGGGVHCSGSWWFILAAWRYNCWQTHQIDMHGDKTVWGYDHCCGTAGETTLIERNTILYIGGPAGDTSWERKGYAIKIRGNPADKAVVDGNVFLHFTRDDAISQNGDIPGGRITKPIEVRPNNAFGVNPIATLGSCDFVGDGRRDHFMATGVTWWALSPVTNQWRYLNTMPEILAQLQLVDVDNDGICDVAEPPPRPEVPFPRYSKSGTEPWTPRIGGAVDPGGGGGVRPPVRDEIIR